MVMLEFNIGCFISLCQEWEYNYGLFTNTNFGLEEFERTQDFVEEKGLWNRLGYRKPHLL